MDDRIGLFDAVPTQRAIRSFRPDPVPRDQIVATVEAATSTERNTMSGKIVLVAATGYTGELAARELVARGARPLLTARREVPLRALAKELGGLEAAVIDLDAPDTLGALLSPGDVVVSTVGPYIVNGPPVVEAAVTAGAHYVDCSGDAGFTRRFMQEWGPRAVGSGSVLVPSVGSFFSTSNLAGETALVEAGPAADRIEIGFFMTGEVRMSGGSALSADIATRDDNFAFVDGRLADCGNGPGPDVAVDGDPLPTLAMSSTDHLLLPARFPSLRTVAFGIGIHGPMMGVVAPGPDEAQRKASGSLLIVRVLDADGALLSEVRFVGPNGYDITASMLAWSAQELADGTAGTGGWLGPLEAFGPERLATGLAKAGFSRVNPGAPPS